MPWSQGGDGAAATRQEVSQRYRAPRQHRDGDEERPAEPARFRYSQSSPRCRRTIVPGRDERQEGRGPEEHRTASRLFRSRRSITGAMSRGRRGQQRQDIKSQLRLGEGNTTRPGASQAQRKGRGLGAPGSGRVVVAGVSARQVRRQHQAPGISPAARTAR